MKLQVQAKTSFSHQVKASEIKESKGFLSTASIEKLANFVPHGVDLYRNTDLLGVAFDAAVVNLANKNGDMMASKTALMCLDTFRHKPTNLEHDRSIIVGHIVSANFSDLEFHKTLYWEDVSEFKRPYFMTLGAVVYKALNKEFAQLLCDIQSGESKDGVVSASWEVGFDEYYAAVGSNIFEECEVVTDDKEVEALSAYMKGFGGKGKTPDGRIVNRLLVGNCTALGIGFTTNPAASVSGVYTWEPWTPTAVSEVEKKSLCNKIKAEDEDEDEEEEEDEEEDGIKEKDVEKEDEDEDEEEEGKKAPYGYCPECGAKGISREKRPDGNDKCEAGHTYPSSKSKKTCSANNIEKNQNKISQNKQSDVITLEQGQTMDIKQLTELIKEAVASKTATEGAEAVASVAQKIADEILEKNKEFVDAAAAAELKQKELLSQAEAEKAKVIELEKQVKANADELKALKDEKNAAIATKQFNDRMALIDVDYELNDEDRKVIVAELKDIGSDEDFGKYSDKLKVYFSSKSKAAIAATKEAIEKAKTEAVAAELEKRGIKNPLEDKKEEKAAIANNSQNGSEAPKSLLEKFSTAFSKESVKVTV